MKGETTIKLYERFEYLSYWFRYQSTYLEMKYHFKRVLKGKEGSYIKLIYHYDRNIGKSASLARLSAKYNIPVIVPSQSWKKFIERDIPEYIPKYFKKKKPTAIVINKKNSRQRKHNVILVEERLTDEQEDLVIKMCNGAVVGYKNVG